MDEFEGNFRIATTIPTQWEQETKNISDNEWTQISSTNNLYIVNATTLGWKGSLEGLAPVGY